MFTILRNIEEIMHILEQAAFSAWPALEEQDHAGWRLRFANGYTKRANSANAIVTSDNLTPSQIDYIEAFYRARNVKTIFRLASFCTSQTIDDALADRGYRLVDMSLVMTMPLDKIEAASMCELLPDAKSWLQTYQEVSGELGTEQENHLQILSTIKGDCAYAILRRDGQPVCCGLGVVIGDHLGLFDLETHPAFRRHGLATQLCSDLMNWGTGRGAKTAFLQVTVANSNAIRLYEGLGFRRSYHYWYRVSR
jgi:ribosomal protein S18 acetylase RimI-like enzyme